MFIGHFAVAFAAKRAAPRTSLGALFVGAQFADMLWPVLLLLGVEQVRIAPGANPFLQLAFTSYPWSHSLLMEFVWGAVLAGMYYALTRSGRGEWVLLLIVPSHWILDLVVHVPDLPLAPGSDVLFGLGLWRSPAATIVIELAMYLAGVAIYARATQARDRIGRIGFWTLAVFLLVLYAASIFSPPPPTVRALALGALVGWPLALWPWWIDRHRTVRDGAVAPATRA